MGLKNRFDAGSNEDTVRSVFKKGFAQRVSDPLPAFS
jgi:hypothetical protein